MIGEDGKQHTISADPLNHCTSLDAPLDDEDGGAATLGDLQEDPAAVAELETIEDELFREQLHSALEEALAKLTSREADVLRRRYYQRQPLREVGEAYGVTWSRAQQVEKTAMRKLRRDPALCRFRDEVIQHHAYRGHRLCIVAARRQRRRTPDRISGKPGRVPVRGAVKSAVW